MALALTGSSPRFTALPRFTAPTPNDLSSFARVGQGERFTPMGGAGTPGTSGGSRFTMMPSGARTAGRLFTPSGTPLTMERSGPNVLSQVRGGIGLAGRVAGLGAEAFNNQNLSDFSGGAGLVSNLLGIAQAAQSESPLKAVPITLSGLGAVNTAGRFLPASSWLNTPIPHLGPEAAAAAASEAGTAAAASAASVGESVGPSISQLAGEVALPAALMAQFVSALQGPEEAALLAGFRKHEFDNPLSAISTVTNPFRVAGGITGEIFGSHGTKGLLGFGHGRSIAEVKAREADAQRGDAQASLSQAQALVDHGFPVEEMMGLMTNDRAGRGAGFLSGDAAQFYGDVSREAGRRLTEHFAATGTTWRDAFADYVQFQHPDLGNLGLTTAMQGPGPSLSPSDLDRLTAGMVPTQRDLQNAWEVVRMGSDLPLDANGDPGWGPENVANYKKHIKFSMLGWDPGVQQWSPGLLEAIAGRGGDWSSGSGIDIQGV